MISTILLCASAAIAFYILLGYPVLLANLSSHTAPPVVKDPRHQPSVAIVIAVYNGAVFIADKLRSLLALDYPRDRVDIVVASDGSTDGTDAIVREFAGDGVRLVTVPHAGKAAALNAALPFLSSEIVFFTDVRQRIDRDAVRHLAANFADPTVGAVSGELALLPGQAGEQADMDLYWRYELWIRKQHSAIDSIFTTTGCIYAIRRRLVQALAPDTIADDATMSLRAFFQGYRVIFDPNALAYDYPAMAGTEFRRRLRTLAGLWQLHQRLPLFSSGNRMRLHFLSYKFGRLVLPWTLLLMYLSTFTLPASPFRTWLLVLELLLPALAAIDLVTPVWFPLKRLSSPARTFLLLNAAALISIAVFFVSPKRLWSPTRVNIDARKRPH